MESGASWAARLRGGARMAAWRAHAYGGGARLESARVPALRAPDHLLVRVRAASLNPLDLAMLEGYGSRILNTLRGATAGAEDSEGSGVEFPLVAGRDFCGTVARAGPAARARPGARVWGVLPPHRPGALADYVLARDAWVGPVPAALDDWQAGGALYAGLSACSVLRAAGLSPGGGCGSTRSARVLLLGLGGVGHAALQLLTAASHQVIVGCAGEQIPRALELGAAAALDRHSPDYERLLQEAGPYDAVIDCAGLGGAEAAAHKWKFARFATLTSPLLRETDAHGLAPGVAASAAHLLTQTFKAVRAQAEASTASASSPAPAPAPACSPLVRWAYFMPRADDIETLRRLAERGQFSVQVERVYPWWDGAAALARARRGSARGKLLIDFGAPPPDRAPAPHTLVYRQDGNESNQDRGDERHSATIAA